MSRDGAWMIYGASGYTGELIAREAVRRGARPVLAGRSREPIAHLAQELDCPHQVFSLDRVDPIAERLKQVSLVLNCAGPFSRTAAPMIEACLLAQTHYLDITGEIDVIELAASRDQPARAAGVSLIPAVGFDVVPSDCLAALVAQRAVAGQLLRIAISSFTALSRGTAKTMFEALPQGGRARIDGEIRHVPTAWKVIEAPLPEGRRWAMTIPWGDVVSAYYSTGIPNIEVYLATPRNQIAWVRRLRFLFPLLAWRPLARFIEWQIDRRVTGPGQQQRQQEGSSFWCEVSDDRGRSAAATMRTASGYHLTVLTALASVERVLTGEVRHGFLTPSLAFGAQFILGIEGTELQFLGAPGEPQPPGLPT